MESLVTKQEKAIKSSIPSAQVITHPMPAILFICLTKQRYYATSSCLSPDCVSEPSDVEIRLVQRTSLACRIIAITQVTFPGCNQKQCIIVTCVIA